MLDQFWRRPPFQNSIAFSVTKRWWCCIDGQGNWILPERRSGQTGTSRNLLKEMRLGCCTGQISSLLHNNLFPFLPSSTTGQWLLFPIHNNWFSRCFLADLMSGEPNVWYGLSSKPLYQNSNCQSLKWDVPWLDHLLIIWHDYHLNKSGSCLRRTYDPHVQDTWAQSPRVTQRRAVETLLPSSSGEQTLLCSTSWKLALKGWFHKQGFRGFKGEKGEPGLPGLDGLDAPCPVVWCSSFPFHFTAWPHFFHTWPLVLMDLRRHASMQADQTPSFELISRLELSFADSTWLWIIGWEPPKSGSKTNLHINLSLLIEVIHLSIFCCLSHLSWKINDMKFHILTDTSNELNGRRLLHGPLFLSSKQDVIYMIKASKGKVVVCTEHEGCKTTSNSFAYIKVFFW